MSLSIVKSITSKAYLKTDPLSTMFPDTPCATLILSVSLWKYLVIAASPALCFSIASRLPIPRYFLSLSYIQLELGLVYMLFFIKIWAMSRPIQKHMLYLTPSWKKYSPGASEVPANKLPIITVEAPNETAFIMWPTDCIPPSAITGTPNLLAYSATKI